MDKDGPQKNPFNDKVMAENAYRVMLKIAEVWSLSTKDVENLLSLSKESWDVARKAQTLPPIHFVAKRYARLVAIMRMSTDLYPLDQDLAYGWVRRPIWTHPFLGKSPLQFMQSDISKDGTAALETTRMFLREMFTRFGAVRNEMRELTHFDDLARMKEEPVGSLAHMLLRIQKNWKLSGDQLLQITGVSEESAKKACFGQHRLEESAIARMQLLACIDLRLWNCCRDGDKVLSWLNSNNRHALFMGKPPLELLLSGYASIMKLMYDFLCNSQP